jgi:hypothetical protein
MSYQEKTIWGTLVSTLIFMGWCLSLTHRTHAGRSLLGGIVVLILIQIAYAIAIALFSRGTQRDERDRLIEYKSYKTAYWALIVFGFIWLFKQQLLGVTELERIPTGILFLAVLGCAELVRLSLQLALYRKDAMGVDR